MQDMNSITKNQERSNFMILEIFLKQEALSKDRVVDYLKLKKMSGSSDNSISILCELNILEHFTIKSKKFVKRGIHFSSGFRDAQIMQEYIRNRESERRMHSELMNLEKRSIRVNIWMVLLTFFIVVGTGASLFLNHQALAEIQEETDVVRQQLILEKEPKVLLAVFPNRNSSKYGYSSIERASIPFEDALTSDYFLFKVHNIGRVPVVPSTIIVEGDCDRIWGHSLDPVVFGGSPPIIAPYSTFEGLFKVRLDPAKTRFCRLNFTINFHSHINYSVSTNIQLSDFPPQRMPYSPQFATKDGEVAYTAYGGINPYPSNISR